MSVINSDPKRKNYSDHSSYSYSRIGPKERTPLIKKNWDCVRKVFCTRADLASQKEQGFHSNTCGTTFMEDMLYMSRNRKLLIIVRHLPQGLLGSLRL